MRFRAKKDIWLSIIIWAAIILPLLFLYLRGNPTILAILIFSLPSALLSWIWLGTYYEIADEVVKYRFGPFNGEVFIDDIGSVFLNPRESLNAGALSTDRITLVYDKTKMLTIAPENKKKFLEELLKVNNKIELIE
jgi:hypothetical protein